MTYEMMGNYGIRWNKMGKDRVGHDKIEWKRFKKDE